MLASYPPRPAAAAEIRPLHRPFRPCSRIRSGIRSSCIVLVTAGFEVVCTFRGLEDFGAGFEGAQQTRDGRFGDFAQEGFELGEGFFDGVHIRTVGWEISRLRARRLDELLDPRPLVSREIVHDDDLAGGMSPANPRTGRR